MRAKPSLLLCLGALAVASAAGAVPHVPGPEKQVNQVSSPNEQRHPAGAYAANGTALVVWEDEQVGLKGRFLGRNGAAVGGDLTLVTNQNLASIPSQGNVVRRKDPAVAFLSNGGFALFWTEETDFETLDAFIQQDTLLRRDVVGRLYNAAGAPVSATVRVNGAGERLASAPQLAVRTNDLIVVWHNQSGGQKSVFARRLDLSGKPVGAELQVSAANVSGADPAIAVAPNGRVAVAFDAPTASGLGVFLQLFDPALHPIGDAVKVNTKTAGDQRRPAIAANQANQFLVAWQTQLSSPLKARVSGQVVGNAGNLLGGQLALSNGAFKYEVTPSVAAGPHGDFVVVWLAFDATFPRGIYATPVDALGNASSPLQVNQGSINFNTRSSVATDGSGHFLVAFEGFRGDDPAIAAQLLSE